ncbi:MAG: putative Ig domain-containing protein [Nitrospirae bacterium]|nr:putative Ig domain-containing protein [Nitrospirota bacterium]
MKEEIIKRKAVTLKNPKSETQNSKLRTKNLKGFTLVEIAIVLVIVGLLIGMGATLIGPLTRRVKYNETKNTVEKVLEAINGFAIANKRLPALLTDLSVKNTDSYNGGLQYYFAGGLTTSNLCTTQGTYLTVNDGAAPPKTNVAFIIFSQGENLCNQTGDASTSPLFNIINTGVQTACIGGAGTPGYDDIVMYQDINTLRQQICNSFKIVTDSLPTGTEEVAYSSTTLDATDGTIPYTWSLATGSSMPPGLNLASNGAISGTPTTDGSYNFTVQVCDNDDPNLPNDCPPTTNKDRVATKSLSITINPNDPRITTEFLTYGTVNQAYPSTILSATGGKTTPPPPYTWAIVGLPAGLSYNAGTGEISGTPTAEGTYPITVTVTDNGSRTASKTLSITINPSGTGGGGGGGGGGSAPTCSVSASPDVILSGRTTTLSFSISNGPAYASFSPQNGTCTTFSGSTGGSCTTGSLSSKTTYVLSVSNANGSASCSTVVFIGQAAYRVWNNTGSRYDFNVDGTCLRVNNGIEITTGALRLNSGETIYRYSTNNGSCGGAAQALLTYNSAVYADSNNNGLVNFTGTDR